MSNPFPEFCGKPQKMTTEAGNTKGLKQTLEEHGFNVEKMKAKCSPICAFDSGRCCLARLLSKQDDFQLQKSQVKEKITQRGHFYIFLPKFHCELNPIKIVCLYFILLLSGSEILQYWGWCKHRYRDVYKEMFRDAKRVTHKSLDVCLVDVIRRFFNQLWRFMEAYWGGLTRKAAEWAVHQQKSHQWAGERAMVSIEENVNTN